MNPIFQAIEGTDDYQTTQESIIAPMPLSVASEKPAPYPIEALGAVIGNAARDVASQVEAPIEIAGNTALAGAALATCGLAQVTMPQGEIKPLNLYRATLAGSNDRKSSTERRLLRFAHDIQRALDSDYSERQGEVDADGNAVELLPTNVLTDSPTVASVFETLKSTPVTGIFSDEGSAFISGHSMRDGEKETLATFNQFYDGRVPRNPRITRFTPPLHDRLVNIHLMIQPGLAASALMDNALASQNGFLSRCLLAQPESLRGGRFSRDKWHDTQAIRDYYDTAARLMALSISKSRAFNFEAQRRVLTFEPNAAVVWWEYRDECEKLGKVGGEFEHVYAQILRSPEHACRIAGILWEFEGYTSEEIGHDTAQRAVTLARWYRDEAIRIAGLAKP